jgi:hypothetical protein
VAATNAFDCHLPVHLLQELRQEQRSHLQDHQGLAVRVQHPAAESHHHRQEKPEVLLALDRMEVCQADQLEVQLAPEVLLPEHHGKTFQNHSQMALDHILPELEELPGNEQQEHPHTDLAHIVLLAEQEQSV